MFDVLQFFTKDITTYAKHDIIMYDFDDSRKDEFLNHVQGFYRSAFISDDDLQAYINGMGTSRFDEIQAVLPTDPIIKSGDFGEILSFAIFTQMYPDYNIAPLKWRWKEDRDRAAHFTDIVLFCCPDESNPQVTDKMMTIEVKTRATQPDAKESSINKAIEGSFTDSVSRSAKTLSYVQQKLKKDRDFDAVKKVMRFEEAVKTPYEACFNAIAIVNRSHLGTHHIGNLNAELINKVRLFNANEKANHKTMAVFVVPINDLKDLYEQLYNKIPNS